MSSGKLFNIQPVFLQLVLRGVRFFPLRISVVQPGQVRRGFLNPPYKLRVYVYIFEIVPLTFELFVSQLCAFGKK